MIIRRAAVFSGPFQFQQRIIHQGNNFWPSFPCSASDSTVLMEVVEEHLQSVANVVHVIYGRLQLFNPKNIRRGTCTF